MKIRLYNSNTKKKELFVPIDSNKVTMYVCGITAYSFPHIGNARGPVVFDVLAKLLRREYQLTYVRNITDLDDKIYDAAQKEDVKISEITIQIFFLELLACLIFNNSLFCLNTIFKLL